MSDILIRGMEMPKYTTKAYFGIDADGNTLCMVYHEDGTEPDIYDVVSLPEGHGRGIDVDYADEYAYDELEVANNYLTGWEAARAIQKIYQNAPTIVPAEGGTNNGN